MHSLMEVELSRYIISQGERSSIWELIQWIIWPCPDLYLFKFVHRKWSRRHFVWIASACFRVHTGCAGLIRCRLELDITLMIPRSPFCT